MSCVKADETYHTGSSCWRTKAMQLTIHSKDIFADAKIMAYPVHYLRLLIQTTRPVLRRPGRCSSLAIFACQPDKDGARIAERAIAINQGRYLTTRIDLQEFGRVLLISLNTTVSANECDHPWQSTYKKVQLLVPDVNPKQRLQQADLVTVP